MGGGAQRDGAVAFGDVAVGFGGGGRVAVVGFFADADVQRDVAEVGQVVADCQQFAAVFAEDVRFMAAVRTGVAAHVFDESQHRHGDFVEHGFGFFRVQQGDVLRGGDDDRACHRDLLGEGELGVAGAGRQVDDEVVKVFPAGFAEELQEGLGDDGAAPDHRGVFFDEVAEREGLQAVARDRLHGAAVGAFRAGRAAEHARLAGAVDVGIEQAGRRAQLA